MKQFLTILITLFSVTITFGQDQITWNEVGVVAKEGYANNIIQTMDNFYGNIEMPEGVSVSLTAVYHSDENHKATHYLNFAGTIEGLVELRQLRSGPDYSEYTSEFSKYGKTISNSHGKTFIRIPGSEDDEANFAQVWEWRVEDQAAFVEEFNNPDALSMLRVVIAPCSPFSVSQDLMKISAEMARNYNITLHTHLAENDEDIEYSMKKFNKSPGEYAQDLGWLGDDVWHAHCVKLNQS